MIIYDAAESGYLAITASLNCHRQARNTAANLCELQAFRSLRMQPRQSGRRDTLSVSTRLGLGASASAKEQPWPCPSPPERKNNRVCLYFLLTEIPTELLNTRELVDKRFVERDEGGKGRVHRYSHIIQRSREENGSRWHEIEIETKVTSASYVRVSGISTRFDLPHGKGKY